MSTDPKNWNFFKFHGGSVRKDNADERTETPSTNEQWRALWPDIPRLFSSEAWRAMEEFFHDPFAGRGALERWFGDFSSSRFQPRIDVVDDGKVLRVTAELPGMAREDLSVSVEGRGDRAAWREKAGRAQRSERLLPAGARPWNVRAHDPNAGLR